MRAHDADLLLSFLDRTLSPEETASVEQRLRREPALAELLIEIACDEVVMLGWAHARRDYGGPGFGRRHRNQIGAERNNQPSAAQGVSGVEVPATLPAKPPAAARGRTALYRENIVIGLAVVVSVTVCWFIFRSVEAGVAQLTAVSGNVTISTNGHSQPAELHADIPADSVVRVGGSSTATLKLADGTTLECLENTEIELPLGPDPDIRCRSGRVTAVVKLRGRAGAFLLDTPQSRIQVTGTRFDVDVTELRTRLDLHAGKVRLTQSVDDQALDLQPGQFAVARSFAEPLQALPAGTTEPLVLLPVADAFIFEMQQDRNFGQDPKLQIGQGNATYLKFDIPTGTSIEQAELVIYPLNPRRLAESVDDTVGVFVTEMDWDEDSITVRERPRAVPTDPHVKLVLKEQQSLTVDVARLIQDTGPVTFILLIGDLHPMITFGSRESGAHTPRLRINSGVSK